MNNSQDLPLKECLARYQQWLDLGNEGLDNFFDSHSFSTHIEIRFRELIKFGGLPEREIDNADKTLKGSSNKLTPEGQYQFVDRLGRGGMGTVWLARQKKPIDRLVAVKLIRVDLDFDEVHRRFELEQQSLAKMSHPNIAQVYDSGFSDQLGPTTSN